MEAKPSQGFDLALSLRFYKGMYLSVGYKFMQFEEMDNKTVSMGMKRHPFRLGLRYYFSFGHLSVFAHTDAELGFNDVSLHHISEDMIQISDNDNFEVSFNVGVGIQYTIYKRIQAFVLIGTRILAYSDYYFYTADKPQN